MGLSRHGATVHDFAGFDAKPQDQFWRITSKTSPSEVVFVFAHTFFDARAVALTYLRDEKGHYLSYDQVTVEALNEGKAAVARGDVFLRPSETLGADVFEATRTTDREGARRGFGLRKREPVALEGRRKGRKVPRRVQADGQEVVQPDDGRSSNPQASSSQSRQGTSGSSGTSNGALGSPPLGLAARSTREGG